MAGLLKPQAAYELISAMKDAVTVPIHLHSHEGSGNTIYTYARAIDAGVDIVDVAMSAMSNGTAQPSASSLYYALEGHPRQPKLSVDALNEFSRYWETIRPYYKAADKTENFPNPEVYVHEMPGGQYTNLKQQAAALGLLDRWEDIKDMYHRVSMMFGDVIKVTPSSKVVGDMTLYMVQNEITEEDVYAKGDTMDFPKSVIEFFEGRIGTPYGGFPKRLQKIVLKGKEPITQRPGAVLPPVDFEEVRKKLEAMNAPTSAHYGRSGFLLLPLSRCVQTVGDPLRGIRRRKRAGYTDLLLRHDCRRGSGRGNRKGQSGHHQADPHQRA